MVLQNKTKNIIVTLKTRKKEAFYISIAMSGLGAIFSIILFFALKSEIDKLLISTNEIKSLSIVGIFFLGSSVLLFIGILCMGLGAFVNRNKLTTDNLIMTLFEKINTLEDKINKN